MASKPLSLAARAFRAGHGAISELVLSPTAARRAVPALGVVTAAGLVLLVRRGGFP
jgi:hypothetical protein